MSAGSSRERRLSVIVRLLFAGAFLAGFACAMALFDAASSAALARERANAIAMSGQVLDRQARQRALAEAARGLEEAWSAPLAWRGEALDVQSWIRAQQALEAPALEAQSRMLAEAALQRAPMNAIAYQRLAAFALRGQPNQACGSARACLDYAFAASPILPEAIACDRLSLAHMAGIEFSADDRRLDAYLSLSPAPARIRQCLGFVDQRALLAALLRARAHGRL